MNVFFGTFVTFGRRSVYNIVFEQERYPSYLQLLLHLRCNSHRLSDAKNYLVHGFTALFAGVGTGLLHRPYVIIGANNRHQKNPVLALEHF